MVWNFSSGSSYPWTFSGMDCAGFWGNPFSGAQSIAPGDPYIGIDGMYEPNTWYYAVQFRMLKQAGAGGGSG